MLRRLLFFGWLVALFFFFGGHAHAAADFTITSFDVAAYLRTNGTIDIYEKIAVDFQQERHGIYRDIPLEYSDNFNLNYRLNVVVAAVTDHNGNAWNYELSKSGGSLRIRIGDADKYVLGRQFYTIHYAVERGMRFFDDHDEFYWNVTGNDWGVPIEKVFMTVFYPTEVHVNNIDVVCFTGSQYSKRENCTKEFDTEKAMFSAADLGIGEGLTVSVSLPKDVVYPPSLFMNILWMLRDNFGFLLPIVLFFILFYIWWTRGRDPKRLHTIVAEFEPPENLTPAEMGTLHDESADIQDISAEIIHLAVNGHLTITEISKTSFFGGTDYLLTRTDKSHSVLKAHQKKLMDALFGSDETKKISELKNHFYAKVDEIKNALYDTVVKQKKYFVSNPNALRKTYYGFGIALLVIPFFTAGFFVILGRIDLLIGIIISGLLLLVFGKFMPQKTLAGSEALRKTLGFKEYIYRAERYRARFAEKENLFESYLPYAMIFGLAEKWAEEFKDIYKGQPNWYNGTDRFNTVMFVGRLNAFASTTNYNLVSSPRSSSGSSGFGSGGFSGGGFGGGGGGSW